MHILSLYIRQNCLYQNNDPFIYLATNLKKNAILVFDMQIVLDNLTLTII